MTFESGLAAGPSTSTQTSPFGGLVEDSLSESPNAANSDLRSRFFDNSDITGPARAPSFDEDNNNFAESSSSSSAAAAAAAAAALNSHGSREGSGKTMNAPTDVETDVSVGQPRKEGEGTSNPFITYLVTTTRTNRETREIRKYALRRRFQDFVWLHDQLTKQFVSCVVPPLPGKHRMEYLTGDRFSGEFVGKRKHGLERFLKRAVLHPNLRTSQHLTVFLEAKDWSSEYETKTKNENGVLDTLGDTLLNTFSKVRKRDDRFVEMRDNIARLEDNLTRTQKLYLRVTKRQQELNQAYEELGTGLIDLGDIETGMTLALVESGNALKAHHLALKQLTEHTEDLFLGEIEEYISYCAAYMDLLKLRDQKQAEFEDLTEYLQQTTAERDRLSNHQSAVGVSAVTNFIRGKVRDLRGVDPAISRQQRIQNLTERIAELQTAVETSHEDSDVFSELVAKEYDIFAHIKKNDFKRAFAALAASHIDFYSKSVSIWKSVIPELEKLPVD
ncbi:intercellular trafficking and secretion [Dipsacomyces acuminosporus]|nr:intercellular trafficking and secretion [Dipsacomyces acuminosporus]